MNTCAILGAGNGGQALAAVCKDHGIEVRLWNRSPGVVAALRKRGGIEVRGGLRLYATPDLITHSIQETLEGADVVLWALPAHAHYSVAERAAPHVTADQIHVLNPGRTGGALEVSSVFHRLAPERVPIVAETQTFPYACRATTPGSVEMLYVKPSNAVACLPAEGSPRVEAALTGTHAGVEMQDTTLATGIENIGAILHPVPVLLNIGWVETPDVPFLHYYHGISPTIAAFLERIDAERLAVAAAYGVSTRSVLQWHNEMYGSNADTLYDGLQSNSRYASLSAPDDLQHRYLHEDIPTGLVPISELGKAAGVPTPLIDLAIHLGDEILGTDYRQTGRTLARLGLSGLTVQECAEVFAGCRRPCC
jgi:opine dehydrogenase